MVAAEYELPPFDLRLAMNTLAAKDPCLAPLIKETQEFRVEKGAAESPYEVLVEAITHQSISGKAAATIYGRVKALGSNGSIPTPHEMLKLRKPALRKAGLSGAKIQAMKDLAKKTIEGIVPTLEKLTKCPTRSSSSASFPFVALALGPSRCFSFSDLAAPMSFPSTTSAFARAGPSHTARSTCPSPKSCSPSASDGVHIARSLPGTCGGPASVLGTPPCERSVRKRPSSGNQRPADGLTRPSLYARRICRVRLLRRTVCTPAIASLSSTVASKHRIQPDVPSHRFHRLTRTQNVLVIGPLPQGPSLLRCVFPACLDLEAPHEMQEIALRSYSLGKKMQVIWHHTIGRHAEKSRGAF